MIVKVSMAKSTSDVCPMAGCFCELHDLYVDKKRTDIRKEDVSKLFLEIAQKLMHPIVMAIEKEPDVETKIWNFETHDFGLVKLKLEDGKRLWIRVGLLNWEFDENGM